MPLPTYAPLPTVTGAISCESLPMNAPSSMVVWCFVDAVVVARDRAGADVDVLADRRVAEIGQVHRPSSPAPSTVFFSSTKLPTLRAVARRRRPGAGARTVRR